jgi:glycosyltransferase involved in cell wall biosynthesis
VTIHRPKPFMTRVPWFARDAMRRHHPPGPDPGTTLAVRQIVARFQPDVVHSYGWISYSVAAALVGSPTPLLLSARDYGYFCAVRNFLHYRGSVCSGPGLLKCLMCAAYTYTQDDAGNAVLGGQDAQVTDRHRIRGIAKGSFAVGSIYAGKGLLRHNLRGLHSVSHFVQRVMDRHLVGIREGDASPLTADVVIPSFLTLSGGVPDEIFLDRLPQERFLLFVGALTPQKGIWPLLDAYGRLPRPVPPLVLIGPTFHNSPKNFPDGAVAMGPASHATVVAAWERALFGLVPSVGAETFGNVVTEAMEQGRPVIGSRLGGIVDIIVDGESGILVPPGDATALAAAMARLLADEGLRDRLGEGARERVRQFEASVVIPMFERVYRDLAAGRRSVPANAPAAQDGRP